MEVGVWLTEKPVFDRECVFVTGQKWMDSIEYQVWKIEKVDGQDANGNDAWYWGLICGDGEEWGPLDDLRADMYFIIPTEK